MGVVRAKRKKLISHGYEMGHDRVTNWREVVKSIDRVKLETKLPKNRLIAEAGISPTMYYAWKRALEE